ncbi:unnamed protein product [Arabidopsis lyrata]|uniref:Uncharacterized protein n=1 Tax=Arabidopsis lyrata subsp. lyrata TaxID=81972 RepID=D7LN93_ARALL|nr:UPF0503 protein At3g09070, chloroplastic [Arabidopsis lyrata subsp. lyrata]EFH52081.1 hypothetical protein ARALYDRAFT_485078 [Arabidopsis lyrata subsp. lyrata]CAH8267724.1 unnamed protein product [Arabidopsis lyrata]|eukprot:XP_020880032.1 UPF0503 protein At3g09070, chloroplastic [Arabidopsis lyrata subsp. lyrata]
MTNVKQTNRRRSSSLCHRHPSAKPTSGFCASCLRERLVTIEAQSPSPAAVQTPELRRIRSYSVRNATVSVLTQPRRRSCDARSSASCLQDLFVDDDEERLDSSIRKSLVPDLKEEEEEDYNDGEDIKGFDRKIVEEEGVENKTMKEFIDLDWGNQIKKNNGKDLKEIASVLSRRLKNFTLNKRNDEKSDSRFAGNVNGRHSFDVDPRLSLDGGRISFEKPRASWDGCLIEKSYHKLTTLSTVAEDAKAKCGVEEEEEEEEGEEKSPGGTVQTKNYYSDSRRRRSFDRSVSIKRQGLLEVDELRGISNAKVSPETVGLFHGAKLLVTEKELRDSNWYSSKNVKSESKKLASKGKICIAAGEGKKQDSVELKKPRKKWPKGWNIWGLIQRKSEAKNEIKTEQSLKLEGNAVEGSLAESLLKLRRVGKGETNGGVSEKLLKSYSVSARKSCDGVLSSAAVVSGFEGGRSSCDGLFHGSINSVEAGRSSCDGLVNGIESKRNHLLQRNANVGTGARENLDNSLFRFYLTPARSHKTSKSGKSRLKN